MNAYGLSGGNKVSRALLVISRKREQCEQHYSRGGGILSVFLTSLRGCSIRRKTRMQFSHTALAVQSLHCYSKPSVQMLEAWVAAQRHWAAITMYPVQPGVLQIHKEEEG